MRGKQPESPCGKLVSRGGEPLPQGTQHRCLASSLPSDLPLWLIWPEAAGPEGACDSALPSCHPSCAGELAGLRQQITATEEKAALDKELMTQKLVQAEREAQASLREQRAAHEEELQRLHREKVRSAGEE